MVAYTRGNVCSSVFRFYFCPLLFYSDHHVKEKDRQKKKDKNKEWKNHKLPPVHDIARENGDVISPKKGKKSSKQLMGKCTLYFTFYFDILGTMQIFSFKFLVMITSVQKRFGQHY